MKRLLVVDDDRHLREIVTYALSREGYDVTAVADGRAALHAIEGGAFDLVVLDVMMPEIDGLEVCRRVRAKSRVPIVFLSSRDEELDRVVGLELGGDDYVTKPFSPRELAARVRAVLRRMSPDAPAPNREEPLAVGALRLDPERHEVTAGDRPVRLTVTEFGLLRALLAQPGRVRSRSELLAAVNVDDEELVTERTIDTHVKRIRKKLRDAGHDPIETVYGVGYRLRAADG